MLRRLGRWLLDGLLIIDQTCRWWIGGWGFVWLNYARANPDETISGWVGRRAMEGDWRALIAERVINTIFWFQPDHCRSSIEWEEADGD